MLNLMIYGMVYLGSILMVYNIYGFIRFSRFVRGRKNWGKENAILIVPIVLLIMFLLGYLLVGIFGHPDLIVAGILFGGSIFVFVIYKLLFGITERIIKSEQLEAELMAAERSNRVKAQFLASVSHEMRTPLNVIIGLVNLALKKPYLDGEAADPLQKILSSGQYLLSLINNIIDLNSIEAGTLTVKNEDFSMPELIKQLNGITETLCGNKGLTYSANVDEKVCRVFNGDGVMLSEALTPILDNAVKYTDPPGSVTLSVTANETDDEDTLELSFAVADTGVGIDSEFIPKLFDLFTQEDTSFTNRYGGSGLGLPAAKSKVELLGGHISVTSEKGFGSVFTLTVPMKLSQNQASADEAEPPENEASLDGKRVLIVDDIDENAEIVADLLELEDAESDRAENGQIAVDMFAASPPGYYDAIIMDLRMPVMDGHESARRIRALDRPDAKTVPIVALTANASEEDRKESMAAGMNDHLEKPADSDELYAVLRKYIADNIEHREGEQGQ